MYFIPEYAVLLLASRLGWPVQKMQKGTVSDDIKSSTGLPDGAKK